MKKDLLEHVFTHCKEAYEYQNERTDKVRDRVSLIVRPLTILGGAEIYVLTKYLGGGGGYSFWLFYLPAGLSALITLSSIFLLLVALAWGFRYSYVPNAHDYVKTAEELEDFMTQHDPKVDVVVELQTQLLNRYKEGAVINLEVNRKRTKLILFAAQASIIAFILLLAALPKFFVENLTDSDSKKETIVEFMSDNKNQDASVTPTSEQLTAPAVPQLPPNTMISENSQRTVESGINKAAGEQSRESNQRSSED